MLAQKISPTHFNGRQHNYIAFIFNVKKPKFESLAAYLKRRKLTDYIIEPKYDGLYIQVTKQGSNVKAYSDQGNLLQLPAPVLKELERLPVNLVVEGELETYLHGKHQPRGITIGLIHKKQRVTEKLHPVLTLFDCLYFKDTDISTQDTLTRLNYLTKLHLPSKITPTTIYLNSVPYSRGTTIPQILKEVQKYTKIRHFEGAILKPAHVSAHNLKFIKFKRYIEFSLQVVKKIPTKTRGVYNYDVAALNEKGGLEIVARSHNSRLNLKPGEKVAVASFNTSVYLNKFGQRVKVRLYSTTIQNKTTAPVNTIKTIIQTSKYYNVLEVHKII